MNWFRRTQIRHWPIDPEKAEFGSLAAFGTEANRECVAVRYRGDQELRCLPIAQFVRETRERMANGRRLEIEKLKIAPIARRRFSGFFDGLTDWSEATRKARSRVDSAERKLNRLLDQYRLD